MLKKARNSYVTLADAARYIRERYAGGNPVRQAWDALPDIDKSRLLLRACTLIEALRLPGRKTDHRQALSWPRNGHRDIPDEIRHAQIEIALWAAQRANNGTSEAGRAELIAQGVTSYSIDDLSEHLDGSRAAQEAMQCPAAALLLRPLTGGGFALC